MRLESLYVALQANLPTLLWSAPGEGKTSFTQAVSEALSWPMETVIASIREPSDFSGLPYLLDGEVHLAPPQWAKSLSAAGTGILFLDELATAPPAVQAALLRVVFERKVGDWVLPAETRILAAANPPEQGAGGWELTPPLANRFLHFNWTVDALSWSDGIVNGFPIGKIPTLPEDWREEIPYWKSLVATFIRTRPELLAPINTPETAKGLNTARAYPTPRTWEYAAILLAAANLSGLSDEIQTEVVQAAVGPGAGIEVLAYIDNLDLPDPLKLLDDPTSYQVPKRHDQCFALLNAVAITACRDLKKHWTASWRIITETARSGKVDICFASVRTLLTKWKDHAHRNELSLPMNELKVFLPLLREAGILPGGK